MAPAEDVLRRYTVLDVFSAVPLAGNALAVVHDADELDEATMERFARETRLSETTFVQAPTRDGADYRNRIFTVAGEIPFAGHPSLGTAVAVARARGESAAHYVQQTGAGLQPVEVTQAGRGWRATMLQEPARFGPELDAVAVMAAVGLAASAVAEHPPQVVSTGLPTLVAPVADHGALERSVPDFDALDELMAPHGTDNLYLACLDPTSGRVRARMFSRLVQAGEDPATGSAAGPLCAYLAERAGTVRLEIDQGVEMGRPSRIVAQMEGDRVRVGGDVVVIVDGTVTLG